MPSLPHSINALFAGNHDAISATMDTTHCIDVRLKPLGVKKMLVPPEVRAAQINCAARGRLGGMRQHVFHTNQPLEMLKDITVAGMDIAMPRHERHIQVEDLNQRNLVSTTDRLNAFISEVALLRGKPIIAVDQEKALIPAGYYLDQRTLQINGDHYGYLESLGNQRTLGAYHATRARNDRLLQEGYFGEAIHPIEGVICLEEDMRYALEAQNHTFDRGLVLISNMLPNSPIRPITSCVDLISPNMRNFEPFRVPQTSDDACVSPQDPTPTNPEIVALLEGIDFLSEGDPYLASDLDLNFEAPQAEGPIRESAPIPASVQERHSIQDEVVIQSAKRNAVSLDLDYCSAYSASRKRLKRANTNGDAEPEQAGQVLQNDDSLLDLKGIFDDDPDDAQTEVGNIASSISSTLYTPPFNAGGFAVINGNSRIAQQQLARRLLLAETQFGMAPDVSQTRVCEKIRWMETKPLHALLSHIMQGIVRPEVTAKGNWSGHDAEAYFTLKHPSLVSAFSHTGGLVFGFARPENPAQQIQAINSMQDIFYGHTEAKKPVVTVSLEAWSVKTEMPMSADTARLTRSPI